MIEFRATCSGQSRCVHLYMLNLHKMYIWQKVLEALKSHLSDWFWALWAAPAGLSLPAP